MAQVTRGQAAPSLTPPDRLLAAADVYHAMTEPRPYRGPALCPCEASRAAAGRGDRRAAGQ